MKKSAADAPAWLKRARLSWNSTETPPPSRRWTAYWVKKFLVYLERRNGGAPPDGVPSMGGVSSFLRFIVENWEVEDWQSEQAGKAVDWLLDAAGSHGGR
ncbi:hypothetical protein QEH56_21965 [Pelagicoccus enzymogenes]|uniref:hypothetical protein n=1 Tax=Pelagicoccus enzymogenes TaxID=2773457 RepID=UPI00280ED189|nr:hypothetical protein [Pelagicoccus enzymogenes]MDQ8200849.1 hypothetical protein [Pelagicoccus enzymogenes]